MLLISEMLKSTSRSISRLVIVLTQIPSFSDATTNMFCVSLVSKCLAVYLHLTYLNMWIGVTLLVSRSSLKMFSFLAKSNEDGG